MIEGILYLCQKSDGSEQRIRGYTKDNGEALNLCHNNLGIPSCP